MWKSTSILQIFIILCLFSLIFADIHRIVLKRERGRNRNHKKRYIREHRKKNNYRNYAPSYVSHVEEIPSPSMHEFSNYYQPAYFGNNYKETSNSFKDFGSNNFKEFGNNFKEPVGNHFKEPVGNNFKEPIGNNFKELVGNNFKEPSHNWDTYSEASEPFYNKYNTFGNDFIYNNQQIQPQQQQQQYSIADLIDLTTASPQRIPQIISSGGEYSFIQTETPSDFKNQENVQLPAITRKRKKNKHGNYEVFETSDDLSSHNVQKTLGSDAFQTYSSPALDTKYVHYSSSVSDTIRPQHPSLTYGKRKNPKQKKSRRSQLN